MRFIDEAFSREDRFAIGIDSKTRKKYLSIPVRNRMIVYDEYYEISAEDYEIFLNDVDAAFKFAEKCRDRKCDDLLIIKPGSDRGDPV